MAKFIMQDQQLDQWCWAAVTASVSQFLLGSARTPCDVATHLLRKPCCRNEDACDEPASLTLALRAFKLLAGSPIQGPLSFAEIQQTIDAGFVIPARIVWDGNPSTAHFVVISGYAVERNGVPQLQVDDPHYGRSIIDHEQFVSSYLDRGQWQQTYAIAVQEDGGEQEGELQ